MGFAGASGFHAGSSGGGGGTIGGGGTLNYISKFTPDGTHIGNSLLYDNGISVGFGTTTPDASSVLDLTSTAQGFLVPRMTSVAKSAIASPATSLLLFDTDQNVFNYWDGLVWQPIIANGVTGTGTINYATRWTSPNSIGDGSWYFSGNDYLPVTTGSNIGDATHRIGTIFMASVFDYSTNLSFYNGTNTTLYIRNDGNIGIGSITPTSKLFILQDTVSTGVKGISVNFNTIGEVFSIDDNADVQFNTNLGVTIRGSNGTLNLLSNGGSNPSVGFKTNNGASTSAIL